MVKLRSNIIFSGLLLVMLVGPRAVMAANPQDAKPVAAEAGEETPPCQKKVSIKGRPHKLNTVASIGAMRAWTQVAKKYGEEYTMWHNAKNPSIKCEKLPRSDFFVCFATGKPCRAATTSKKAGNKTN